MELGACLRNKSMRVRVLPSALFEYGSSDGSERLSTKQEVAGSSPAWVTMLRWSSGLYSGPVNRQRWFDSSTKLLSSPRWSSGYDFGLPNRQSEFDSHTRLLEKWSGGPMVGRRSYKPDVEGSIPSPTTLECGCESSKPRFYLDRLLPIQRGKAGLEDSPPHSKLAA